MSRFSKSFDPRRASDIEATRRFDFPSPTGTVAIPSYGDSGEMMPPVPREESAADAPFSRLIFPPRIEKLPGSTDFRVQNYQVALAGVVGAVANGPTFRVPQGQVGWLQNNEVYVLAPTGTTLFSMQIRINDGPVPGYDNIQMPPGIANFVRSGDDDMHIRIPNGGLVSIVFTNLNATALTVGGLLQGWYHPLTAELRAWGAEV